MNMQFHNFISMTAVQLATLSNPGAAVISQPPASNYVFVGSSGAQRWKQWESSGAGEATAKLDTVIETPGEAATALARLRKFASWKENWDGEGAKAPDRAAIDCATAVLGLLQLELGRAPSVQLSDEGQPTLTLIDSGFELMVNISADREISYFVARGEDERGDVFYFDGMRLPSAFVTDIKELRHLSA